MSIVELVFAMVLIWMAIDIVCIAIGIMASKPRKHFEHDIDQKTWERIEGWRK